MTRAATAKTPLPRNGRGRGPDTRITKTLLAAMATVDLPSDAPVWERRIKALSLRNNGLTYAQIADALHPEAHNGRSRAMADVKAAIKEIVHLPTDQMVDRQRSILIELTAASLPDARAGDKEAAAVVLRCLEHEAKLYGLYAPSRVQVGISKEEFGAQAAELLAAMGTAPLAELSRFAHTEHAPAPPLDVDEVALDTEESWSNL